MTELPEYKYPPVSEVAISLQFEPLRNLRIPFIGLLWQKYSQKKNLVHVEERPPLKPQFEIFGNEKLTPLIEISHLRPIPRCWFINPDSNELVQLQEDRFVHNWRKVNDKDPYPRYENIRKDFLEDLRIFTDFIKENDIGELIPNQCEITYVNRINASNEKLKINQFHEILSIGPLDYSDNFLEDPENISFTSHYIIKKKDVTPLGRLHISFQSASDENGLFFLLKLIARGRPQKPDMDGILEFMDLGREWIVKGFTSITTKKMHKNWERQA